MEKFIFVGSADVEFGVECLESLEKIYFERFLVNKSFSQPNLAFLHTKNLSSPSREIEILYLKKLHDQILNAKEEEIGYF